MNKQLLEGKVSQSLILFTIPLVLGNILQQFYNIADSYIVGHYINTHALGAVGSAFSLMVFLTSIILGLCLGSGVLFSMLHGANKTNELRNAIFISFVSIGLLSIFIEVICLINIKNILYLLNIPEDLYRQSYDYTYIVIYGLTFTFIYNFYACLLRALGNSKTPLLFLIISTLINIVLDYVLIVYCSLDIKGAAFATIIAQSVSGFGLMIYTHKKYNNIIPKKTDCFFNKRIFNKIKDYSLMTCLQQSIMNFGILMIQGLVNSFGSDIMSAFSICVKIDAFAYMPVQDFGNAFSTFIALNTGAKKDKRIAQAIKSAITISAIFSLIISFFVFLFSKQLLTIFINSNETQIISHGIQYLHIEGMFYILKGWLFLFYGYFRGIGKPYMSLILTIISLGTRVLLSYVYAPTYGVHIIWWSIVIGWFLADLCGFIVYIIKQKR